MCGAPYRIQYRFSPCRIFIVKVFELVTLDVKKGNCMSRAARISVLGLGIVFIATSAMSAIAETKWERNHPRRDQVNDRLENQNRRINRELREDEITKGQAQQLHSEDRAIRNEERTMSKFNNGHITPAEQKALNQQENAVSKQIGR
jgi:hypothetical protein